MSTSLTDTIASLESGWASTALFLYDIVITFDDDIEFVWRGSWSLPKTFYVLSRYFGFAASLLNSIVSSTNFTDKFCQTWDVVQWLIMALTWAFCDGLLSLRVSALLSEGCLCNHLTRILLFVSYTSVTIINIIFTSLNFMFITKQGQLLDEDNYGCMVWISLPVSNLIWPYVAMGCLTVAFQGLLLSAALSRVVPVWRQGKGALSTLLLRDGLGYFFMVFSPLTIMVIMDSTLSDRPALQLASLPWTIVLSPIGACRLFLNLKASRRGKDYSPVDQRSLDGSDFSGDTFQVTSWARTGRATRLESGTEMTEMIDRSGEQLSDT